VDEPKTWLSEGTYQSKRGEVAGGQIPKKEGKTSIRARREKGRDPK